LAPGVNYSSIPTSGGIESRLGGSSGGPGFVNPAAFAPALAIMPDGVTVTTQAACSSCATIFGNSGLGIVRGPDQVNFDVSILKNISVGERHKVQFRSEFFNIGNHPVFANPTTARNSTLFGIINQTIGNPRLVQFALKYSF
jgi:hypothetical protein